MHKDAFDSIDARLLGILQGEFPLVARPFDAIADALGIAPRDVIERVSRLKRESIIRQISAIFDSAALGYVSTLVAFRVAPTELDRVAEQISLHEGVSHCYSRDADYNLWFTLTASLGSDLDAEIAALAKLEGVQSHLILPALKVYKIGVFLDVAGDARNRENASFDGLRRRKRETQDRSGGSPCPPGDHGGSPLRVGDRAAVRALQKDLPIVESPFAELARELEMSEDELLARAKAFLESGVMRRYAAVLRHQRAGYRANAMVCWQVELERIDEAGAILASHPAVSHCYQRPASADWPYPLYTMVHCRDEAELERVIADLAASVGLTDFRILRSIKEYKKSRVAYFE